MTLRVSEELAKAIRVVSEAETGGRFDLVSPNVDGAGLAFGILQWTQKNGRLGTLLQAMQAEDAARFARIFGASAPRLIEVTSQGSFDPVDGAPLWEEPWLSRFEAAGRDPVFQQVQVVLAAQGEDAKLAHRAWLQSRVTTGRSLALFLDTVVQQGRAALPAVVAAVQARADDVRAAVAAGAQAAANRHRWNGQKAPTPDEAKANGKARGRWKLVGGEWHHVVGKTGNIDLYTVILRRRGAIATRADLDDVVV